MSDLVQWEIPFISQSMGIGGRFQGRSESPPEMVIERPNHVWVTDITYIRMQHGFLYLCVILD